MTFHVNDGGTWKESEVHVNDGGTWKQCGEVWVNDGGTWKQVLASGPSVSPSTSQIVYTLFSAGTCYATVRFSFTGVEYKNAGATDTGSNTSRGNWLDSGNNDEVWINRIINSGTLNRFDAGSGRKIMTVDRTYGISNTNGTKTTNMTFEFWDAASGGNLLASVTYNLKTTVDQF